MTCGSSPSVFAFWIKNDRKASRRNTMKAGRKSRSRGLHRSRDATSSSERVTDLATSVIVFSPLKRSRLHLASTETSAHGCGLSGRDGETRRYFRPKRNPFGAADELD